MPHASIGRVAVDSGGGAIPIFSGQGKFLGSIDAHDAENVLLQQVQFEKLKDADFVLDVARRIVAGKVNNSRVLLQRRGRKAGDERVAQAVRQLANVAEGMTQAATLDEVRGYEGAASAAYFDGLGACFAEPFSFTKRTRRPPQDPINALLSFGYAMLFQNIHALVRARGLSPHVGMLHALRQGHPALCSDLIEELRAPVVDALVTTVINRKMFKLEDFSYEEADEEDAPDATEEAERAVGAKRSCRLTDEARKRFIAQFEVRMNTAVRHKHAGIRTTWRGCIDLQIGHYIKVLRGEAEHYQALEFV